ncbi:pilus assembly protein TadG-related protein [Chelativorans sp. Marseille-P2723]|uniref:pilus assembly protein TadG-related protein n=1 Tax=Chelativorans sp. Marseille-P2723 TaxID=2709133 RepID=UPI0015712CF6|nr:pilus assembly protein TadG-related protein [Chelativorans sp. Marseille-P2723]
MDRFNVRDPVRDRSGNVAMMSATLLFVVIASAALAVDLGSIYFERREAQALTDLAAITAASHLEKAPEAAMVTFTDNHKRNIVLVRDGQTPDPLEVTGVEGHLYVETGRYLRSRDIKPDLRFSVGGEPANAVEVRLRKKPNLYFASAILSPPVIETVAVAAVTEEAAISVGSRLVSINEGILNGILGALLGTNLSLDAMDFRALADTDVDLLAFMNALASELKITAGTYEDVLAAHASLGMIVRSLSASAQGSEARAALEAILASPVGAGLAVPLSLLVDLGPLSQLAVGQESAGLNAAVGAMELIGSAAAIANRDNQVQLESGFGLPGLAKVTLKIAIGEPPLNLPWLAVGERGTITRTGQTRLQLKAEILGSGVLRVITLPIYLEVGYAEAKLRDLVCEAGQVSNVVVDARPGVFEAWVGEINEQQLRNFKARPVPQPARLVDLVAVRISGTARVMSGNMQAESLNFDRKEIERGQVETVDSHHHLQPLVQSLLSELSLDIDLLGLGLGLGRGSVTSLLGEILSEVTEPLDSLVYGLLTALGVRVGEADIRVNGSYCGRSVLVN